MKLDIVKLNETQKLIKTAFSIALNVILGQIMVYFPIPFLFLDTIGTIYSASFLGISYGIICGLCTNLVLGILNGPTSVPFAAVNIAVAIVTGYIAKNTFSIQKAIGLGLILSFVCSLIGTPIQLLLFGGFTGSCADALIFLLNTVGEQSLFAATFSALLVSNLVDKTASCILIAIIFSRNHVVF